MPILVGALESVSRNLEKELEICESIETVKVTEFFRPAKIHCKVAVILTQMKGGSVLVV